MVCCCLLNVWISVDAVFEDKFQSLMRCAKMATFTPHHMNMVGNTRLMVVN